MGHNTVISLIIISPEIAGPFHLYILDDFEFSVRQRSVLFLIYIL